MSREEIKDLLMSFLPREWSMKTVAFESAIDEVVDDFEQQIEMKDIALEAQVKIIQQLKKEQPTLENTICKWTRTFDSHFNISCVNKTGERANGNFKGKDIGAQWEFKFCPYCGGEIELDDK